MDSNYLSLPIGKISKEELRSWFGWIKRRDYDNFSSFPLVVDFFSEINETRRLNELNERAGYFQENDLVDPSDFLQEKILFFVRFKLYNLIETSVTITVKFLCDGTVRVYDIYVDDSENNKLIAENIKNINHVIRLKEVESDGINRMSWKDFKQLFEEIESGNHNVVLEIPKYVHFG
ncbi:MAG: hypothetical protein ACOYMB_03850 [Patescibacteria group bacterium]